MRHKDEAVNFWDPAHFTSLDNKLPIYPRRKGYVDFNGMTKRPPFKILNLNEARFLTTNPFPSPVSTVKHSPKFFFDKQLPRDNRVLY